MNFIQVDKDGNVTTPPEIAAIFPNLTVSIDPYIGKARINFGQQSVSTRLYAAVSVEGPHGISYNHSVYINGTGVPASVYYDPGAHCLSITSPLSSDIAFIKSLPILDYVQCLIVSFPTWQADWSWADPIGFVEQLAVSGVPIFPNLKHVEITSGYTGAEDEVVTMKAADMFKTYLNADDIIMCGQALSAPWRSILGVKGLWNHMLNHLGSPSTLTDIDEFSVGGLIQKIGPRKYRVIENASSSYPFSGAFNRNSERIYIAEFASVSQSAYKAFMDTITSNDTMAVYHDIIEGRGNFITNQWSPAANYNSQVQAITVDRLKMTLDVVDQFPSLTDVVSTDVSYEGYAGSATVDVWYNGATNEIALVHYASAPLLAHEFRKVTEYIGTDYTMNQVNNAVWTRAQNIEPYYGEYRWIIPFLSMTEKLFIKTDKPQCPSDPDLGTGNYDYRYMVWTEGAGFDQTACSTFLTTFDVGIFIISSGFDYTELTPFYASHVYSVYKKTGSEDLSALGVTTLNFPNLTLIDCAYTVAGLYEDIINEVYIWTPEYLDNQMWSWHANYRANVTRVADEFTIGGVIYEKPEKALELGVTVNPLLSEDDFLLLAQMHTSAKRYALMETDLPEDLAVLNGMQIEAIVAGNVQGCYIWWDTLDDYCHCVFPNFGPTLPGDISGIDKIVLVTDKAETVSFYKNTGTDLTAHLPTVLTYSWVENVDGSFTVTVTSGGDTCTLPVTTPYGDYVDVQY